MAKHKDRQFQFRVDEDTLENAQEISEQRGLSLSAVLRAFLGLFARNPDAALEDLDLDAESEKAEYDHRHARILRNKPRRRRP